MSMQSDPPKADRPSLTGVVMVSRYPCRGRYFGSPGPAKRLSMDCLFVSWLRLGSRSLPCGQLPSRPTEASLLRHLWGVKTLTPVPMVRIHAARSLVASLACIWAAHRSLPSNDDFQCIVAAEEQTDDDPQRCPNGEAASRHTGLPTLCHLVCPPPAKGFDCDDMEGLRERTPGS